MAIEWADAVAGLTKGPATGLYWPSFNRSVAGILPAALERIGVSIPDGVARLDGVPVPKTRFRKVLFFLVDSLGLDDLLTREGSLTRWVREQGAWITSVFPSITSSAITSIFHGVQPAEHGIFGHRVWNANVGNVIDMLTLKLDGSQTSLPDAGVDVAAWTRTQPLLSEKYVGKLACYHLTHAGLLGSGLSNFVYPSNVIRIGYGTSIEGLSKVKQLLLRDESMVVSYYTSAIDATSHGFGKRSPEFAFQLGEVERGLEWLVSSLPPSVRAETLFALASDHGQSVFDRTKAIRMTTERQSLYKKWGPHGGLGNSGRVLHMYGDGAMPAPLAAAVAEDVGARGVVLTSREANALCGWKEGTPEPADGQGAGASVVALHDGAYFDFEHPPARVASSQKNLDRLLSNHGSLTAEELLVPTLLAGMDGLGRV